MLRLRADERARTRVVRTVKARLAIGMGLPVYVHARLEAAQRQPPAAGVGVRRRSCRRRCLLHAQRGRRSVSHGHAPLADVLGTPRRASEGRKSERARDWRAAQIAPNSPI